MKPRLPLSIIHPLLRRPSTRPLTPFLPRLNSTAAPTADNLPPSPKTYPTSAITPLPSRRLLEITGPDARSFLQGLTTIDLQRPTWSPLTPAAFLSPQGRILFDVHIYHLPPNDNTDPVFLVEHDAAVSTELQKHLRRYKLRSKATFRLLDEGEKSVYASWGVELGEGLSGINAPDHRAPGLGWRHLLDGDSKPQVDAPELSGPEGGLVYRLHRYLRGIAEGPAEIESGRALVHEYNLDKTGAVNFKKGCYVGQELTIRTQHTGVVRRRVLPVRLYAPGTEMPKELRYDAGEDVVAGGVREGDVMKKEGGKRSVGRLLGRVGNVGLATSRLEVMTGVVLDVQDTPYEPGAEFVVKGAGEGEVVGVRAFVPEWLGLMMKLEPARGE